MYSAGVASVKPRVITGNREIVVQPEGPLTSVTAESFKRALLRTIENYDCPLLLDLSEVPYCSSAGFHAVMLAAQVLNQRGQKLRLTNASASVRKAMEIVNLAALVEIVV